MVDEKRFDEQLVEEFNIEFDFDETKFNRFLAKAKVDLDSAKEQVLYELGCGTFYNKGFFLTATGVLFFGLQPEKFFPQSYVTCVRYHGNSMASVIDRKDLYGDLVSLVDESEAFVKRHTRLAYLFDGFKRVDIEEYPYKAIREAIINAVCHRDYPSRNNVFVNVFDDRVEVISPGTIPDNLTLKEVYGRSHPRNFKILELFHKIDYIEKIGSGLKRMEELMLFHGLKKPVYETNRAFFQATFLGPKEKILELVKPSNVLDLHELGLNEDQVKALNFFQNKKQFSALEYQKLLGTTKRTAQRHLKELIKNGLISKQGIGKKTIYSMT
ncbi:MAG: ATP-binding protein [Candidatus ainarchaeum sp.]|nr:ATP-binding protein [Candidatus ainarchaeum sp.]